MAYGDGTFVAIGYNPNDPSKGVYDAYSTDGTSWKFKTVPLLELPGGAAWTAITYGDGRFAAVGVNGSTEYSTNGLNWTVNAPLTGVGVSLNFEDVTYGDGEFVAVGPSYSVGAVSNNGETWTIAANRGVFGSWSGVAYGDGEFVTVQTGPGDTSGDTADPAAVSSNGAAWTLEGSAN